MGFNPRVLIFSKALMFFFYLAILLLGHLSEDMITRMPKISCKTTGNIVHNVATLERLKGAGP